MLLVKLIEPPCTERYARWCERSVGEIIAYLLLDSEERNISNARDMAVKGGSRHEVENMSPKADSH